MPIYLYMNEETEEVKEILQGMNDVHEYEEDGVKWKRIFTSPHASIDTQTDPFSIKDYYKATENKKETMGSLQDRSKEASEQRAAKSGGVDPVKQKFFKDYSEKRRGIKHKDDKPKGGKGYTVDY